MAKTPEALPPEVEIDVFGSTHVGRVRPHNEDQFLISSLHKHMQVRQTSLARLKEMPSETDSIAMLMMVADGVGGKGGGREASEAALEAAAQYAASTVQCFYTGDPDDDIDFLEHLEASVYACHETVLERAAESPDAPGMATTLTVAVAVWPWVFVVQVGDSRCYLLHDGQLTQVTRDQTVAQDLYDQGVLNTIEVQTSHLSHVLTSAIGGERAEPVITKIRQDPGDAILLCTDGLTKHVTNEEIRDRLAHAESAEQACQQLIDDALEGGGSDNVTVVVGRLRPPR